MRSAALSPDRYPVPLPRAFVYHGSRRGLRREPGPGATVPGEPGRAEERAFRRRSPRLTSPPSYHSRTWFLNLIPSIPAPKFWTLQAKTVSAARIGGLRLFEGGDNGANSELSLAAVLSLGSPARVVLPRPLEGDLEDARERALSPPVPLLPEQRRRRALPRGRPTPGRASVLSGHLLDHWGSSVPPGDGIRGLPARTQKLVQLVSPYLPG